MAHSIPELTIPSTIQIPNNINGKKYPDNIYLVHSSTPLHTNKMAAGLELEKAGTLSTASIL
jgi:hypothetical protein